MAPIITFRCRACDSEIALSPEATAPPVCPSCKQTQEVRIPSGLREKHLVTACICCGHEDLYVQKDFNRHVGVVIVGLGAAASIYFFSRSEPFYAMGALALTAAIDFLIYRLVGEVAVCYACHTIYRGFARNPEHEPFDLKKLEKYGGRTPRF